MASRPVLRADSTTMLGYEEGGNRTRRELRVLGCARSPPFRLTASGGMRVLYALLGDMDGDRVDRLGPTRRRELELNGFPPTATSSQILGGGYSPWLGGVVMVWRYVMPP